MLTAIVAETPALSLPIPEQKAYQHHLRKPVNGVGVNDFPGPVRVNGALCTSYTVWANMLKRCYSVADKITAPTYAGCLVAEVWHRFSVFDKWFSANYVEGWQLDKDILISKNRVYSPDTCVFIPQSLNLLLAVNSKIRGPYPLGVTASRSRFVARVKVDGKQIHLGVFKTVEAAHKAWQLAKAALIESFPVFDPRIRKALDLRAAKLREEAEAGHITTEI